MKKKADIGIVIQKDFTFGQTESDALKLDCGKILSPVNIRYETYGELNPEKTNAILILHALSGNAHVAGYHTSEDKKPGWWDDMVGPGKAFDTDKYHVVCSNFIGSCSGSTGPISINPSTGKRYNMSFPFITISDMVRAQKKFMEHLGISKWLAVAGGSIGGMQAIQWAIDYPDSVKSVLAIATATNLSPQGIAFNWVGREAIMSDPNWNNGEYEEKNPEKGLSTARMLAHITYLSDKSMDMKFGRKFKETNGYNFDFSQNFEVESYLDYQGQRFVERFDANSYLYITRAMDYYDPAAEHNGDLVKAFSGVKSKFLVVSFTSDWLFPPESSRKIVRALQANDIDTVYCNISSDYGHDAFLLEVETLEALISDFLSSRFKEVQWMRRNVEALMRKSN